MTGRILPCSIAAQLGVAGLVDGYQLVIVPIAPGGSRSDYAAFRKPRNAAFSGLSLMRGVAFPFYAAEARGIRKTAVWVQAAGKPAFPHLRPLRSKSPPSRANVRAADDEIVEEALHGNGRTATLIW